MMTGDDDWQRIAELLEMKPAPVSTSYMDCAETDPGSPRLEVGD